KNDASLSAYRGKLGESLGRGVLVREIGSRGTGRHHQARQISSYKSTERRSSMWRSVERLLGSRPKFRRHSFRRVLLAVEELEHRIPPAQLTFLTQPSVSATGVTMSPVTVSSSAGGSAPITLSLGNNQSGLQLEGTVTENAVNGQATFSNLVIASSGGDFSKN